MSSEQKIWLVWNPNGRAPTCKHESKSSAKREAERLATLNVEQEFYVVEALGKFQTRKPVTWTNCETLNEVPF